MTARPGHTATRSLARRTRAGAVAFLALVVCVLWAKPMGLLLWARIRILTNIPRTAIADDVLAQALKNAAEDPRLPAPTRVELPVRASRDPFERTSRTSPHDRTLERASDRAGEAKSNGNNAE